MLRRAKVFMVLYAVAMVLIGGLSVQDASAVQYFWQEKGVTLKENKEVVGTLASASFKIRSSLAGGSKFVVTCTGASFLGGAVIFNGETRLKNKGGRWHVELELTGCSSTVCLQVVGGKIKVPLSGNADGTIVSDAEKEPQVLQLYVSLLPLGKEFTKFTLKEGECGAGGVEVPIVTPFTRGGFGEALEGEGGLPVQVDGGVAEARTEKLVHELGFSCSGEAQVPEKAWDTDAEEVKVGNLKFSTRSICIEGKLNLKLASKAEFKIL